MDPLIEIKNLSFTYPDGKRALDEIDLLVSRGEKIALVGANGAGKTTLLLHLNGILTGNGSVHINNLELNKKNLPRIRALVGLVFQNPDDQLFSTSVFDDVAFGLIYQGIDKKTIHEEVPHALKLVNMSDYLHRTPYHLSNGEKKRIAIATVLVMHPEILVFDEPTTGLDPRARREFIELLSGLTQTMLIATHDMDLVRQLTPRTIILNQGKIVADGPTDRILEDMDLLMENGLV